MSKQFLTAATKERRRLKQRQAYQENGSLMRARQLNFYKTNIPYKLRVIFSKWMVQACERQYVEVPENAHSYLGCSVEILQKHIESLWKNGMTWQNHGRGADTWQIDHVRASCSFDLSDPSEMQACFHFSNVRPLWYEDHKGKSAQDRTDCYRISRQRIAAQRRTIEELRAEIAVLRNQPTS